MLQHARAEPSFPVRVRLRISHYHELVGDPRTDVLQDTRDTTVTACLVKHAAYIEDVALLHQMELQQSGIVCCGTVVSVAYLAHVLLVFPLKRCNELRPNGSLSGRRRRVVLGPLTRKALIASSSCPMRFSTFLAMTNKCLSTRRIRPPDVTLIMNSSTDVKILYSASARSHG